MGKAEDTKARLERAALTLFVARGVAETTTKEIAMAASVAEGTIYRYFPSKEQLALDLFLHHHRALAEALAEAQRPAKGLRAKIDAIVGCYCDWADRDWTLFAYHLLNQHSFLIQVPDDTPNPVNVVREVIAGMFYSTGPRRMTSASVILVEQFSDIDLPNTAAMDEEHGIALCSGFDRNKSGGGVRYAVIEIATKQHPKRISLDLSCVTSSGECTDIREFFHPEDSPEYRAIIDRSDATCSSKAQPYYP